eukprot:11597-Heterococcus_DN1.PRE.2
MRSSRCEVFNGVLFEKLKGEWQESSSSKKKQSTTTTNTTAGNTNTDGDDNDDAGNDSEAEDNNNSAADAGNTAAGGADAVLAAAKAAAAAALGRSGHVRMVPRLSELERIVRQHHERTHASTGAACTALRKLYKIDGLEEMYRAEKSRCRQCRDSKDSRKKAKTSATSSPGCSSRSSSARRNGEFKTRFVFGTVYTNEQQQQLSSPAERVVCVPKRALYLAYLAAVGKTVTRSLEQRIQGWPSLWVVTVTERCARCMLTSTEFTCSGAAA